MSGLDLFALIVLIVIALSLLAAAVAAARLPGQIARSRQHPQAEAVAVAGWVGLLAGGVLWPVALIWAFSRPPASDKTLRELRERVADLEARMSRRRLVP